MENRNRKCDRPWEVIYTPIQTSHKNRKGNEFNYERQDQSEVRSEQRCSLDHSLERER
jgi:hypothetical protein